MQKKKKIYDKQNDMENNVDFLKYCIKIFILIIKLYGAPWKFVPKESEALSPLALSCPSPGVVSTRLGGESQRELPVPTSYVPSLSQGPEFDLTVTLWKRKDHIKWNSSILSNQVTTMKEFVKKIWSQLFTRSLI